MLYFIPAWYQANNWCENEQSWHVRRMQTEFDDTVKQIQLFHRSGAYPYQILLLSFAPNLRHFLHRQGVYRAPYWSCFDAIQEVRRKKAMLLSFHNLNWPAGIEFIYTPFVLLAMLKGEKYAQAEFGEDGNLIRIDMYEKGRLCRRNIYDDRGFVSSSIVFEDEKPLYQDYLMENGVWKLRCFQDDGHVEVNQRYPNFLLICGDDEYSRKFSRRRYKSMEQVISEVFSAWLILTEKTDLFCAALHSLHASLLSEALKGRKMLLSYYGNRFDLQQYADSAQLLKCADYIIADSAENAKKLRAFIKTEDMRIAEITPFDTRVDSGISQQLRVQKILVPVDGIAEKLFEELVCALGMYLYENENAVICLFTRQAAYNRKQELLTRTRQILKVSGLEDGWAVDEDEESGGENEFEEGSPVPIRFLVEQCVDELAVSKCMKEQRVIADLREVPELYLQILAVSIGIPQIVRTNTQYVENGRNGFVLHDLKRLPKILNYYLDGLKNWNEARIASYELSKKYTTQVLLDKWKEVIDIVGRD